MLISQFLSATSFVVNVIFKKTYKVNFNEFIYTVHFNFQIMLDYAKHVFRVYKDRPKFVFGFHGEISHDSYNLVGAADDDFKEWLSWLKNEGHLNNTLLILMSDHGHR